ncbi:hypothetical protein DNTS_010125, partial [Danionella cerebrum]
MSRGQSTSSNISSTDKPLNTMALPKLKARPRIARKPVIASLAGTTKAVSLFQRPQPPAKPRSECPLSAGASSTHHTPYQQVSGEDKKNSTRADGFPTEQHQFFSGSSDETVALSSERDACQFHPDMHHNLLKNHGSTHNHNVKSSSQLLEEARIIAGVQQPCEDDQQRALKDSLEDTSVKESLLTEGDSRVPTLTDPETPQSLTEPGKDSELATDGGGHCDLMPQVINEDVIMTTGCNLTCVQRAESKSFGDIQGLSLLATWKPKKNSTGYKTIHHLCTTPLSQVMPVDLQLATRMSHTQNLSPATAHFFQQRAGYCHASPLERERLVSEGVSIDSAEVSAQTDCIFHMAKQTSDTLKDWQKIAEYYVERPRIMMCGRAKSQNEEKNEDLTYELDNLMEDSIRSVMLTKRDPSEDRRPSSAPILTPDLEPYLRLQSGFTNLSQELKHVRWQQNPICTALAGELPSDAKQTSEAISLEPYLLDAYWHRHRIYLLRNDPERALDDLNIILVNNKKHADALMSRAEIYKQRGETTLALFCYTQALEVKPDDAEIYFRRGKMYNAMGMNHLAMEDYFKTFNLDSTRTDALMIHGIHGFQNCNWTESLEDFSLILKQEPKNHKARTYRGRIFSKLGHFEKAVEDFTLAVHLNPNDWLAFYHRGCLLREIMPQRALRDLSTSVLINDSAENQSAFLHRGLVYVTLHRWQQAMADFEAVIKLDRGKFLYEMNQCDLTALSIRYAAEMKSVLGLSLVQQAVIHSFLGNDANAIVCLEQAIDTQPSPLTLILLGQTLMREHRYTESEDSLLLHALDAFNSCVNLNPDHAHALHQRGLCRIHLHDSTGVQDFNRALRINSNLY